MLPLEILRLSLKTDGCRPIISCEERLQVLCGEVQGSVPLKNALVNEAQEIVSD